MSILPKLIVNIPILTCILNVTNYPNKNILRIGQKTTELLPARALARVLMGGVQLFNEHRDYS